MDKVYAALSQNGQIQVSAIERWKYLYLPDRSLTEEKAAQSPARAGKYPRICLPGKARADPLPYYTRARICARAHARMRARLPYLSISVVVVVLYAPRTHAVATP